MKGIIVWIMILIRNSADRVMQQKQAMHLFVIYLNQSAPVQFMETVMCGMFHHGNYYGRALF